jgi:uncharacterized integral membrane protein
MIIVVFALQNSNPISVKLFFWDIKSSAALIITSVLFIGALLGVLFSLPSIFKKRDRIEELEEQLAKKEEKK